MVLGSSTIEGPLGVRVLPSQPVTTGSAGAIAKARQATLDAPFTGITGFAIVPGTVVTADESLRILVLASQEQRVLIV